MNTNVTVSDIREDVSKMRREIGGQFRSVSGCRVHPPDIGKVLTGS